MPSVPSRVRELQVGFLLKHELFVFSCVVFPNNALEVRRAIEKPSAHLLLSPVTVCKALSCSCSNMFLLIREALPASLSRLLLPQLC